MTGDEETLRILEVILTAEILNRYTDLDVNDLTPFCREIFGVNGSSIIKRPLFVNEAMIRRAMSISDAHRKFQSNPMVLYEDAGQRFSVPAFEAAARWFLAHGGRSLAEINPTLAFFFEKSGEQISYAEARTANPRFEDSKVFLDAKIEALLGDDERLRDGFDLIIVTAPDEIEQKLEYLVCTPEQYALIGKIQTGIEYRDFFKKHRIHEVGKLLFVGPPGTGKTSIAHAISRELHRPLLEVRLSMVTSQYLGETSKNIDRIFEIAKKMAPCTLFIDEFDFVAKSRVTDDHGAMKRAVNALLKNIDQISLIRHNVILIGATNHPKLLDEAAWRRFDEIVPFPLPDAIMREEILKRITSTLICHCDYNALALETDGFSGSDLRMIIKEGAMRALMTHRQEIQMEDIETGILQVKNRNFIRDLSWL
jgi:SpoVK/Ycf46/Vps4 family AAA+-type ATPase